MPWPPPPSSLLHVLGSNITGDWRSMASLQPKLTVSSARHISLQAQKRMRPCGRLRASRDVAPHWHVATELPLPLSLCANDTPAILRMKCQRPCKHSSGAPLPRLANLKSASGEPVTRLSGRNDGPHHADVSALAIVPRSGYVPVGPEFACDCGIGGYCTDGADATCRVARVNGGDTILTMRRTSSPKPWRINPVDPALPPHFHVD
ncbi:hypothetical protein EDB85DRAFT_1923257 [Lactarius pseudohatsudake]|nr:hypothetical protein EDB85DRAFT_1923257 [Lactarius pseudohatsudake]